MRKAATKRHKVTLVGLGAMGRRHARVLCALQDRFELVGALDVRGDVEPPPGIARLCGEAEAIARAEVVVVATPTETHAAIVSRALAAGRDVLVEKPLCATAADARAVASTAGRDGARLFVGHSERFNPVVRALAKLVRCKDVLTIDFRRVGPCRPSGCGVLLSLGVHDLDLAAYLGGGEVALRGALVGAASGDSVDDLAHVLFSTAAGGVGHLYVDRNAPTKERVIEVATPRWTYRGDLLAHRLVRVGRSGRPSADVPLLAEEPLHAQAVALADALDGGIVREIATGADGARAVDLAERAAEYGPRKVALGLRH